MGDFNSYEVHEKALLINEVDFTYQYEGVISQKQFEAHIQLYHNYILKTNEIIDSIVFTPMTEASNAIYSHFRGLKIEETYALDSIILHELYFRNMCDQVIEPIQSFKNILQPSFLDYDDWKKMFVACCKAARGWVICAFDQRTGLIKNFTQDTHNLGPVWYAYPLIVIDMYEHAYYLDYVNDKDSYISHFIEHIHWQTVDNRMKLLSNAKLQGMWG